MATSTISQITSAAIPPSGGEFMEIERSGASFRTTSKRIARTLTLFSNEFSKNQNIDSSTLSIVASAVDISFANNGNCKLSLTEDAIINSPIDLVDGRTVLMMVTQSPSANTLSFHTDYDFADYDFAVNIGINARTWYTFWTDGINVFARKIWEDN